MINHGRGILVWLGVSDLTKTCDFYAETLGLEMMHMDMQSGWAEFVHPNCQTRIAFVETDPDEIQPSGGASLVFDVPDLEECMKKLEKAGVPFLTGIISMNGHTFATFIDPDGNNLQLREYRDE